MSVRRWPDTLPGPSTDGYALSPIDPTLRTSMEAGSQRTRRRILARLDRVKMQWRFNPPEYAVFRAFYEGLPYSLLGASDDLSIWSFTQRVTRSAAVALPPDFLAVDRALETAVTGTHQVNLSPASLAVDSANLTFSATIKPAGRTLRRLWLINRANTSLYTEFDLSDGTLAAQSGLLSRSIEDRGNGWWRIPGPGSCLGRSAIL